MKMLVVGDNCIDRYVYCKIDRISPEAPVLICDELYDKEQPGMAGNVYKNIKSLGINVDFFSPHVTCKKTRFIDVRTKHQVLRVDKDYESSAFGNKNFDEPEYNNYDAVVISDYDKGFVSYKKIQKIRDSYTGPIFMDTKKRNLGVFDDIFIKINEKEYNNTQSLPSSSNLIVTMSQKGCRYLDKIYEAPKVDVFDVTGAGDTFLAALAVKYIETSSITNAIEFANKCAAISVTHQGCYVLTKEDIKNL